MGPRREPEVHHNIGRLGKDRRRLLASDRRAPAEAARQCAAFAPAGATG
jgi:hypothetical protein